MEGATKRADNGGWWDGWVANLLCLSPTAAAWGMEEGAAHPRTTDLSVSQSENVHPADKRPGQTRSFQLK